MYFLPLCPALVDVVTATHFFLISGGCNLTYLFHNPWVQNVDYKLHYGLWVSNQFSFVRDQFFLYETRQQNFIHVRLAGLVCGNLWKLYPDPALPCVPQLYTTHRITISSNLYTIIYTIIVKSNKTIQ